MLKFPLVQKETSGPERNSHDRAATRSEALESEKESPRLSPTISTYSLEALVMIVVCLLGSAIGGIFAAVFVADGTPIWATGAMSGAVALSAPFLVHLTARFWE